VATLSARRGVVVRTRRRRYDRRRVRALCLACLLLLVGVAAVPARASELIDRNASDVELAVSRGGIARLTYSAGGHVRHVLVWGASGARQPSADRGQVRFRIDWTGGRQWFQRPLWKTIRNACGPYRGPALAWLVAACTAPDGSNWALQSWQRLLPHRGFDPWLPGQTAWELRLSHWSGQIAVLEGYADWAFGGEAHDLFGRYTYLGGPVYGLRQGDTYARNLYIDTYDSSYGPGWRRETSVLARKPNGNFCYAFYPTHDATLPGAPDRPAGNGARYRITAVGPGVTPDVAWEGAGLPNFDPGNAALVEHEREMNELADKIAAGDRLCLHH
jgi:hypothetical protein